MKLWPASEEQDRLDLVACVEAALTALPGDAAFLYWWGTRPTVYLRPVRGPRVFTRLSIGWYINSEGATIRRMFVEYPTVLEKRRDFVLKSDADSDTLREIAELAANLLAYGREHVGAIDMLAEVGKQGRTGSGGKR